MMITSHQIDELRERVAAVLSAKRMSHVLGVEDMAVRLGRLYFGDDAEAYGILHAAALLHDVTKELTDIEQLAILESCSVKPSPQELASMPTIHALTGALIIPEYYPEFADERVIAAVRYHTTGRVGMSMFEKIIFLADYIEETRPYPPCTALRKDFFAAAPECMESTERIRLLDRAILRSVEDTVSHLRKSGSAIHPATLAVREELKRRVGDEAR